MVSESGADYKRDLARAISPIAEPRHSPVLVAAMRVPLAMNCPADDSPDRSRLTKSRAAD